MDIKQEQTDQKGSFFVEETGERIAEMTYSLANSKIMIIDHTWVNDSLRGKKVGNQLVEAGVQFARDNGYKILPLCTFANKVLKKDEAKYADILHK